MLRQLGRFNMCTATSLNRSIDGPVTQRIISKLHEQIKSPPIYKFEIFNDSYKHSGHNEQKGLNNTIESHIRIILVSDIFQKMPIIKRHKLIYSILKEELETDVHALQLTLKTEKEYLKS